MHYKAELPLNVKVGSKLPSLILVIIVCFNLIGWTCHLLIVEVKLFVSVDYQVKFYSIPFIQ